MIVEVPKVLREKLGDEGCTALVDVMNHAAEKSMADVVQLCTQRFERRLAEAQAKTQAAVDAIRVEVAGSKVELIRWLVGLLIIQGIWALVLKHWM